MSQIERVSASFRDPSGHVFVADGKIRRHINPIYFKPYDALCKSGLYELLIGKKMLIPHREIERSTNYIILESETIPFISYPYEWSFLQYKHAALLTLQIQKICLEHGFTLKDASAFNVTFHEGRPVFIDTLSFDFYNQDTPWNAYKQFITHFLGPMALSHYFGLEHLKTLIYHIDGIPIGKLSRLLPWKSHWNPTLWANVHLLAKLDKKHATAGTNTSDGRKLRRKDQVKLLDNLYQYLKDLQLREATEWDEYYSQLNYSDAAFLFKKNHTKTWFAQINGKTLMDAGGNDGTFARELAAEAQLLIVADIDANAVAQNYRKSTQNKEHNMLPLVIDLLNPAPAVGFANTERASFLERLRNFQPDGCLALALIHHLTLSGNVPFERSAQFFASVSKHLLIEFPGREDSWVKFLLESKREFKDHFHFYDEVHFEAAYGQYFEIQHKEAIPASHRTLYTMVARNQKP